MHLVVLTKLWLWKTFMLNLTIHMNPSFFYKQNTKLSLFCYLPKYSTRSAPYFGVGKRHGEL